MPFRVGDQNPRARKPLPRGARLLRGAPGLLQLFRPGRRDLEHDRRPLTLRVRHGADRPAMVTHDRVADRQAETDPLADLAGGEEGIEDPAQVLGRNAGTIVGEGDHDALPLGTAGDRQGAAAVRLEHRLLSVVDQVSEHHLHLMEVAHDQRQLRVEIGAHADATHFQVVGFPFDRLQDDAVQAERLLLSLLAPGEGQEMVHDGGGALRLPDDHVDPLARLRVGVGLLQELRVAHHAAERIVQLVRHARQEIAERQHLLVLDHLLLRLLDLPQARLELLVQPGIAEGQGDERRQDHGVAAIVLGVPFRETHPVHVQDAEELVAHGERADDRGPDGAPRGDAGEALVPLHVGVDHHRLALQGDPAGDPLSDRQMRALLDLPSERGRQGDAQPAGRVDEH